LLPVDILLTDPVQRASARPAELDTITGRLNPPGDGAFRRMVYLSNRLVDGERHGEFNPCGICGKPARFVRSSVQDHQTKGDQPFQALVARQIEVQQPTSPRSDFAPLEGRKSLLF